MHKVFRFEPGINPETVSATGILLLCWPSPGGWAVRLASTTFGGPKATRLERRPTSPATIGPARCTIIRPDGSELRVECYGPADAPPIVLTHGWGADSTEWYYQKKHLAERFRLIVWDEPGLGLSKKPTTTTTGSRNSRPTSRPCSPSRAGGPPCSSGTASAG